MIRTSYAKPSLCYDSTFTIVYIGSAFEGFHGSRLVLVLSLLTQQTPLCPLADLHFVQTWKAVNNLGVALLSQGKLQEVRLCPFWCAPCLCLLRPIATFPIGLFVCDVSHCSRFCLTVAYRSPILPCIGYRSPRRSVTQEPI